MATLAKLLVQLGLEDNLSSGLKGISNNLTSFGRTATMGLTLPLLAVAGASVKMASDLNENINKVNVVFGESAASVQAWSTTTAKSLGISRNEALQATGSFGNLLTNFGLTQDAAASMSMDIVKLSADLGSFNNLPTSQVLEAIRSGLVGESEPLRQLGIDVSDATVKAKALALGLWDGEGALSAAARATAVMTLITEQSGNAYNDFAETSSGAANQTKILRAQLADAGATLGTQLLPLLIQFVTNLNGLIASYQGLSPQQQKVIEALAVIAGIIGPLALALGFIITNAIALGTALGTIIAPLTIVVSTIAGFATLIGPVVLALGVMKLAGVDLGKMFTNLKATITSFTTSAVATLTGFVNSAKNLFTVTKTAAVIAFSLIRSEAVAALLGLWSDGISKLVMIKASFSAAWTLMKSEASTAFTNMASNAVSIVGGMATSLYDGGVSAAKWLGWGIIDGINAIWDSAVNFAGALADAIINKLHFKWLVDSPSKKTAYLGEMLGAGLIEGMASSERKVFAAANSMSNAAATGMSGPTINGGMTIQVSGAGDPNAVADKVFARFVREMALTTGGV